MDIAFYFTAHEDKAPLPEHKDGEYGFLRLRPEPCVVRLNASLPCATTHDAISYEDLSQFIIAFTNYPLYKSSEQAIKQRLLESGVEYQFVDGDISSKHDLVEFDPRYAAIMLEDVTRNAPYVSSGFSHLKLTGEPLTVQPYAIFRLDNPNPDVAVFMDAWKKALEGSQDGAQ